MPLSQKIAALYALTTKVVMQPNPNARSQLTRTIGAAGEFDCEQCDDLQKQELGGCPFLEQGETGTVPSCVDFTGDDDRDLVWVCPQGIRLTEPALALDVERWHKIAALGGPEAYFGPGLGQLPTRVTETLITFAALEQRYLAEIRRTRAEMDRVNYG